MTWFGIVRNFSIEGGVLYWEEQYLQISSLTAFLSTLALTPFGQVLFDVVTKIKFYLIAPTFWQGFCFQLVAPSDLSLKVGLLILAPLPPPSWDEKYSCQNCSTFAAASVSVLTDPPTHLTVSCSSLVSLPTAPTWRTSSTMQKLSSWSVLVQLEVKMRCPLLSA